MNLQDKAYNQFGLVRDMMAVPEIIPRFDPDQTLDTAAQIATVGRLLITGEGSSRIFPATHAMMLAHRHGYTLTLHSEAGRQAQEYALDDWAVFAMSNSGRTSEVIKLFQDLAENQHKNLYCLTATPGSRLESLATKGYLLTCGGEGAVAATKSVIEQAMFCQSLVGHATGRSVLKKPMLAGLAASFREALTAKIDPKIVEKIAAAPTVYFAGRNDGVAQELTLKANEIIRKKSDFLEGTYAVHGVEEVMDRNDVVVWIDPYEDSEAKFTEVLCKGVGLTVVAIASRPTGFPTIRVPDAGELSSYVHMAAGWNLLVEAGVKLGINLDKPQRARKVGNEFVG